MWLLLLCLHLGANEQNEFVHVDLCKSLSSLLEDQIIFLPSLTTFHTKHGLTSLRQIMKYF
jgi:hypothetical protein